MSRFRKSEYRVEKRSKPAPEDPKVYKHCQGNMGLCTEKKSLAVCGKCGKPFCATCGESHPKYCLGIG